MLLTHPAHPGRRVRLAYCTNLYPAEDLPALLGALSAVSLPLRERLVARGESFGVGLYLPAQLALALAAPAGRAELLRLRTFLAREGLDPFSFNAFPYGGFHRSGLKRRVFEPRWSERARLEFTLAVTEVASALASEHARDRSGSHLSISTHSGRFGPWEEGEWERAQALYTEAALALAEREARGGPRIVLAIEPEPRASAGDSRAAAELHARLRAATRDARARAALARHLGCCLDCCHSAVEFEEPSASLALATQDATPLGKLQFSSALALRAPGERAAERALLLGLDEDRYLHQVRGLAGRELLGVEDLPELALALADPRSPWLACDEWRCHFHVPVDLEGLAGSSLCTTRAHAERVLALALAAPERWGSAELHVEIETYTWDVLPRAARGAGELVDGLEREYRQVLRLLEREGWRRSRPDGTGSAPLVDTPRPPQ